MCNGFSFVFQHFEILSVLFPCFLVIFIRHRQVRKVLSLEKSPRDEVTCTPWMGEEILKELANLVKRGFERETCWKVGPISPLVEGFTGRRRSFNAVESKWNASYRDAWKANELRVRASRAPRRCWQSRVE